jgi:hypothetical protein
MGPPAVQSDRKKHLLMDALVLTIHQKKFAIPSALSALARRYHV